MKRRHFLGASTAFLVSNPIRSIAQGHGPADDLLPPISVTAPTGLALPIATPNGPAGGYHWAINGDNIRGGIFQIGKFRLVNGKKSSKLLPPDVPETCFLNLGMGWNLQANKLCKHKSQLMPFLHRGLQTWAGKTSLARPSMASPIRRLVVSRQHLGCSATIISATFRLHPLKVLNSTPLHFSPFQLTTTGSEEMETPNRLT